MGGHITSNVTLSSLECDILKPILVPHAGIVGMIRYTKQDDNALCIPLVTIVAVFWVPPKRLTHTDKIIIHIFIKSCAHAREDGLYLYLHEHPSRPSHRRTWKTIPSLFGRGLVGRVIVGDIKQKYIINSEKKSARWHH